MYSKNITLGSNHYFSSNDRVKGLETHNQCSKYSNNTHIPMQKTKMPSICHMRQFESCLFTYMFRISLYILSIGILPQMMSKALKIIPSVEVFPMLLISPFIDQGYHWEVKCGGLRCWYRTLIHISNLYGLRPKFPSPTKSRTLSQGPWYS